MICAWLDGELPEEEKTSVERRIADDPGFERLVAEMRAVRAQVALEGRRQMRNMIKQWETELPPLPPPPSAQKSKPKHPLVVLAAAVLLVVLLGAAYYLLNSKSGTEPKNQKEELFAQYFEPYPSVNLQMGTGEDALQTAYSLYSAEQWEACASAFEKALTLLAPDTATAEVAERYHKGQFFQAQAYLAGGKPQEAIRPLEAYLALGPQAPLYYQCTWYLALAAWQTGDIDRSKNLLRALDNAPDTYKVKEMGKRLRGEIEK